MSYMRWNCKNSNKLSPVKCELKYCAYHFFRLKWAELIEILHKNNAVVTCCMGLYYIMTITACVMIASQLTLSCYLCIGCACPASAGPEATYTWHCEVNAWRREHCTRWWRSSMSWRVCISLRQCIRICWISWSFEPPFQLTYYILFW